MNCSKIVLKISVKSGEFVSGTPVLGTASKASGNVLRVLKTEFNVDLRSYYDNLGNLVPADPCFDSSPIFNESPKTIICTPIFLMSCLRS